ncbi:(2Fe-2S) ferredoxin domain-containing protein [Oceanotoga sp. DSM 15011]|jgi:NADH:ubiquinone oxidoreductase subunit E|uniref:NADH dehydrogenase subunit E n=1 Tax=Oceanotoga teriensis TaxID=515440 RepID=A0AA45C8W0_9BACT|nr:MULTISPECIES: (2Fe-2S) ferredoxin domain-containing protein [Oceanotoga]MDN5342048.1 hypothetical protein [Oceanotoga sp.]MDO7975482.1 (2Fe-2S) ferredoxin domain-containing protein [Oceanotoga teriensis]PWJ96230.1 NADH dehydrogenase subunit E [Oceanotoga teriensis]UYP00014.1 (2Fe-2S) ferredoxin domain-containing protein [Oceanotoga sp. DSM 15011]
MIDFYVCMGSACYLKGSNEIVEIINRQIEKHDLKAKVHLKGSFCLGPCNQGVVIKVGDKFFKKMSPENTIEKFENEIIPYIEILMNGGE